MMFRALVFAAVLLAHGELRAEPAPAAAAFEPKLTIYLARGPDNSCGAGCDRWIAVEGTVDAAAAARVGRFLRDVKDTKRPIYFHSPGGSVEPAYAIGRLLRSRKAVARVGRTIVTACAAGTQIDDACLKIKNGGGEVEATISTHHAMCNSACSYLFLGATTREVAPDAAVAVHNSKLTLLVRGHPSPQVLAAFRERSMARADRERTSFIAAMGIGHELNDLIRTVKFENMHILTRPELYRFGVDTRAMAETGWTLEAAARPYIRKIALARRKDGATFRTLEWRLYCENKNRARLMFGREFDSGAAGMNSVVMMAGSERPVSFGQFPARIGTYEAWSGTIASDAMKTVLAASHLQMGEATSMPDGRTSQEMFDIDTMGLEPAWTQLVATCPAAPNPAAPASARAATAPPAAASIPPAPASAPAP
jgi:hypothetical protein